MNEAIFFLAPLNALLWQLGGTYNKLFRRIGFPVLVFVVIVLAGLELWKVLCATAGAAASVSLPFTLVGDKIRAHWFNWCWIFIAPFILMAPSLFAFSWERLIFMAWASVVLGTAGVLSNLKATRDAFVWKVVEGMTGFLVLVPYQL